MKVPGIPVFDHFPRKQSTLCIDNTEIWNRETADRHTYMNTRGTVNRETNELLWFIGDDDDDDEHGDCDGGYNYDDDEINSSNTIEPSHVFWRTKQLHS
jgi:hypothetical protein